MNFEQQLVNSIITASAAIQEYNQKNGYTDPAAVPDLKPIVAKPSNTKGWSFSDNTPSPANSLTSSVSSIIGKKIHAFEFDHDTAQNIQGMCTEYETYAEIFISKGLNFCWQRFIYAKELCHLLLNHSDPECRTTSQDEVQKTLDKLILGSSPDNKIQATELTAYIAATELLFPNHIVQATMDIPVEELSKLIRCPKQVIALRRHSEDMKKWFDQAYANPSYQNALIHERIKRASK